MLRSGTQSSPRTNRLPVLDHLRFIAAMLVVAYHFLFRGGIDNTFLDFRWETAAPVLQYAYFGVQLFFIISGLVILWSAEKKDWLSFGIARFIRLWPGYFLAVTLTALATLLYAQQPFETDIWNWAANLTFFAPALGQPFMDGVYWTIVLELIFYFWVTVGLFTRVLPKHMLAASACWLVLIAANEFWLNIGALRTVLITRYGAWFVIGIALYHIWSRGRSNPATLVLIAAIAISMWMAIFEQVQLTTVYGYAIDPVSPLIANSLVIALVAFAMVAANRFRATRRAAILGALTYPLYLLHQNIGYMAINTLQPWLGPWVATALTTLAVCVLAWAVHVLWENPVSSTMKNAARKLLPSLSARATAPVSRIGTA